MRYLRIDKPGKSNCTIRTNVNGFNAWEQKILVLQVGETRMHSPSLELQSVSGDAPANGDQATVDLELAKTESIIPENPPSVTPLTGLDGFCAFGNASRKFSHEGKELWTGSESDLVEVWDADALCS